MATLHSPVTGICRLRYLNSTRTTASLLSLAAYHHAQGSTRKNTAARRKEIPDKHGNQGKHGNRQSQQGKHAGAQVRKQQVRARAPTVAKRTQASPKNKPAAEPKFTLPRIHEIIHVPTPEELPNIKKQFLARPGPVLQDTADLLEATVTEKTVSKVHPEDGKTYQRSTVTVRFSDRDDLVAIGDGQSQRLSLRAANIHALAKLHEAGLLEAAWVHQKSREEVASQKDGILDVFNYAARYCCIPDLTRRCTGRAWNVKIEMPDHEIKAAASVFGDLGAAELAATLEFKKQAEAYQSNKGTESLIVKDSTTLNTSNALEFYEFCRDYGEIEGSVEAKTSHGSKDQWISQMMLNNVALGPPVTVQLGGKRAAESIAHLLGALSIVKDKPQLLEEFSKELRAGNGRYLGKLRPADMVVSRETLQEMKALNLSTRRHYGTKQHEITKEQEEESTRQMRRMPSLTASQLADKSANLQQKLESYQKRTDLEQLRQTRSELPMSQYAPQVLEIVQNNIYCVIIGATGSGKTTQVPQILLDHAIEKGFGASCNVVCTQPRRIAATSVARRVADERAEMLQDTVGYQVRFDAKLPKPAGSILYCTTGILLQQLQHAPDEVYDHVSHLVIDEVHERDILIDFLLIMLKETMAARVAQGKKVPHVILMSATIDAEQFAAYFKDSLPSEKSTACPTLRVPGRTFPVKDRYLEDILREIEDEHGSDPLRLMQTDKKTRDYLMAEKVGLDRSLPSSVSADAARSSVIDWKRRNTATQGDDALADKGDDTLVPLSLAAATIAHITKTTNSGAILVFLPGLEEMTKLDGMLREQSLLGVDFNDTGRFQIFTLHSSIQQSQKTVFDPLPDGCRKVILSTNIAETSVTIPDVQFVVDTGKSREKLYDQVRRITQLQCTWISKSNVKQRAGRAGRVQNGNYYALFTRSRHESMRAVGLPELLRSDLQEICLDVKTQAFKMPVREFLAGAIEPPSAPAVETAMQNLTALGALTEEEELTPLGRLLASLPIHPTLGKMIVLGIIFRCLEPMIILGATAHERPLLANPPGMKTLINEQRRKFAAASKSDHIMLLNAFQMAREAWDHGPRVFRDVCSRNFIHEGAFKSINSTAREIEGILGQAGLIPDRGREDTLQYGGGALNQNAGSQGVIRALLLAGLYPNIAMQKSQRNLGFRTQGEKFTFVHPSSVNHGALERGRDQLLTFTSLALSNDGSRMNLRDTTVLAPLMAVLFGGRLSQRGPVIEVDGWLPFFTKAAEQMAFSGHGGVIARELMYFRNNLNNMLAIAFSDLSRKKPLSGDLIRGRLASGLAKILAREASGLVSRNSTTRFDDRGNGNFSQRAEGRSDYHDVGAHAATGRVSRSQPGRPFSRLNASRSGSYSDGTFSRSRTEPRRESQAGWSARGVLRDSRAPAPSVGGEASQYSGARDAAASI